MAFREGNSALYWAATRPEDITPAGAVAVGHFVQVGLATPMCRVAASCRITRKPPRWTQREDTVREMALAFQTDPLPGVEKSLDTARTSACATYFRTSSKKACARASCEDSSLFMACLRTSASFEVFTSSISIGMPAPSGSEPRASTARRRTVESASFEMAY